MPKIKEIYNFLDNLAPFDLAEDWDNVGLIIGNMDNEIKNIYLALELENSNIEKIKKDSLIIAHHPLIFRPLKTLDTARYPTNLIQKLLSNNINLISMHTNFDTAILNPFIAKKLLLDLREHFSIVDESNKSYIYSAVCGTTIPTIRLEDMARSIATSLQIPLEEMKIVDGKMPIKSLKIICGSGASIIPSLESGSLLFTGDVKYHDAMIAIANGVSVIDFTHFHSEKHFAPCLSGLMADFLQNYGLTAIMLNSFNPFLKPLQ